MATIRVGTASPCTQATTPATIALLAQLAARASRQKIDILVLPEAFIGGYPRGSTFGCAIGSRTAQGREEFVRYFEQAVDLGDTVGDGAGAGVRWVRRDMHGHGHGDGGDADGGGIDIKSPEGRGRGDGTREELERIARDTGVFLVTGLIEKTGGSLYCAVVYVCPQAGMVGKRRKVQPTGSERLIWAQGNPATLRAISTTIRGQRVNLAAAICWENYMPLVRQALYAQNVNLYVAPTADARDTWMSLMRTVGIEGRCFVVSSNMCVRQQQQAAPAARRHSSHAVQDTIAEDAREDAARDSSAVEGGEGEPPASIVPAARHRRRKSVFDEDGNEIVLSCSADAEICEDESSPTALRISTHPAHALAHTPGAALTTTTTPATTGTAAFSCRGGSSIVSPFGDVLAGPQWEDDHGLIYADIDLRDCIGGRLDLDTAGSYSRNDSFKFSVEGLQLDPLPY
ncbi:Bifunctional nitrilase/nitrile hydratase NIT4 [Escovopsis weberi]|uniref:Bifunctional nitrilase/nitrile hydratase NIT4 n=1 Tax=Escovopsis weberi TaxID=150374 RepID=A0A0N0RU97_ESCWE|nr:Bifunctional nitrilase/nitrile hydratase NIT4 [Escovopsis weberi]